MEDQKNPSQRELVDADVRRLNEQFYISFDSKYFMQKCMYLAAIISKPDVISQVLTDGVAFKKLQLQIDESEISMFSSASFVRNLRSEVALTYFHAVETLFRLFFAHASTNDCPWFEVSTNNDFSQFKRDVRDYRERKYFTTDHQEALAEIFFGRVEAPAEKITPDVWSKSLLNLSEFMDYFADQLLESFAYNSYKHGLAVFNKDFGFSLGDIMKVDKDDAFLFLSHEKDEVRKGFHKLYRNYVFTQWESKFALVYQLTHILENLISVGKGRYVGGEYKLHTFENFNLIAIIKNGDSVLQPSSVKESSFSFEAPKKSKAQKKN
jgi:hypothetical protein